MGKYLLRRFLGRTDIGDGAGSNLVQYFFLTNSIWQFPGNSAF